MIALAPNRSRTASTAVSRPTVRGSSTASASWTGSKRSSRFETATPTSVRPRSTTSGRVSAKSSRAVARISRVEEVGRRRVRDRVAREKSSKRSRRDDRPPAPARRPHPVGDAVDEPEQHVVDGVGRAPAGGLRPERAASAPRRHASAVAVPGDAVDEAPRRRPEHGDEVALGDAGRDRRRCGCPHASAAGSSPGRSPRCARPGGAAGTRAPRPAPRRASPSGFAVPLAVFASSFVLPPPTVTASPTRSRDVAPEPRCDLPRRPVTRSSPVTSRNASSSEIPSTLGAWSSKTRKSALLASTYASKRGRTTTRCGQSRRAVRAAHRAADPVAPRLVARRQHDSAAHDDRTAAEARVVPLLDGREERVGVGVEDRPPVWHEHMFASVGSRLQVAPCDPPGSPCSPRLLLAVAGGAATAAPPAAETRAVGLPVARPPRRGRHASPPRATRSSRGTRPPGRRPTATGGAPAPGASSATLLDVTAAYRAAHPEAARIGIGDLSRPQGGEFGERFGAAGPRVAPERARRGRLLPAASDGRERPPDRPGQIARRLAQELVDRFVAAGAVKVFVGPRTGLTGPPAIVEVLPQYHDNHLHVRLPGDGVASAELGTSTLGRSIRAFRVGRGHARVLVVGCVHGDECAGSVIATRLLHARPPEDGLDLGRPRPQPRRARREAADERARRRPEPELPGHVARPRRLGERTGRPRSRRASRCA